MSYPKIYNYLVIFLNRFALFYSLEQAYTNSVVACKKSPLLSCIHRVSSNTCKLIRLLHYTGWASKQAEDSKKNNSVIKSTMIEIFFSIIHLMSDKIVFFRIFVYNTVSCLLT